MDYKEKYEQALDRAKEIYDTYRFSVDQSNFKPTDFEYIFPELRESEDERIRKEMIAYFQDIKEIAIKTESLDKWIAWLEKQKEQNGEDEEDNDFIIYHPLKNGKGEYECIPYSFYGSLTSFSEDKDLIYFLRTCFYTKEECNEWIEQQKEQKPIDKEEPQVYETENGEVITYSESEGYRVVEPKFKVGDWVVCENTGSVYQIKNCIENPRNHKYGYDLTNGGYIGSNAGNLYHLWTIQDAKDGDVLFTTCNNMNEMVFIYHGIEFDATHCYFLYSKTNNECKTFNSVCSVEADIHPATKEQRDLLFQKMKEAGYDIFQSWDTEKLELRKIEQKPNDESWQDKLANLNEKLAECSKYNVRILNTGDGLYMCNILDDSIEDEVYAENFYEDELYDLIDSVQNYLMNKIKEQR